MKCVLINPNIVSQINDFSGSGIPYMPIGLAYLAAYLRDVGHEVSVIDAFGEAPDHVCKNADKFIQGLDAEEILVLIHKETEVILLFAHLAVTFYAQMMLLEKIRRHFPSTPIGILENIHNVNSYGLLSVKEFYLQQKVDYLILGYLEERTARLLELLAYNKTQPESLRKIPGLAFRNGMEYELNEGLDTDGLIDLDSLPFPAWDLFPLENYWKLKYAHAPFTTKRYLALLSSRGCPFKCRFCVSDGMESNRKWISRSPKNIVDEIVMFNKLFKVDEFHFEDLNPGISKRRIMEICSELSKQDVKIQWKIAQGTKLEYLDEKIIKMMAEAGCRYVSISPESGSEKILHYIHKPVDLGYSIKVVKWLKKYKIISQGCFIIGIPTETKRDLQLTRRHLLRLARAGLDDPAIFIITPMFGSKLAMEYSEYPMRPDQCTFTPVWRKDYSYLARFRQVTYLEYLILKIIFHPISFFMYLVNFSTRNFQTKVEMTIYRKLYTFIKVRKGKLK